MQPIWAQLTRGGTKEERNFNIKLMLNSRQGDISCIDEGDKFNALLKGKKLFEADRKNNLTREQVMLVVRNHDLENFEKHRIY